MNAPANSELVEARLIEFCSRLIFREVDAQTLKLLQSSELLELLKAVDPAIEQELSLDSAPLVEFYAEEYARLFCLPDGVSPRASAYLGQEPTAKSQAIAEQVDTWANRFKLQLRLTEWGRLPKDNVCVLLGLLAVAILREPTDPELTGASQAIKNELIDPWLSAFCQELQAKSHTVLYRVCAQMLDLTLTQAAR